MGDKTLVVIEYIGHMSTIVTLNVIIIQHLLKTSAKKLVHFAQTLRKTRDQVGMIVNQVKFVHSRQDYLFFKIAGRIIFSRFYLNPFNLIVAVFLRPKVQLHSLHVNFL